MLAATSPTRQGGPALRMASPLMTRPFRNETLRASDEGLVGAYDEDSTPPGDRTLSRGAPDNVTVVSIAWREIAAPPQPGDA